MGKYQAYPEYKDSGIEWADSIPAHWGNVKLRWISERYAGGTPSKAVEAYWENGTVPWLNSGEVNQGLITTASTYITEDAYKNSSAKWIPKNALVMALAGQGKTKGMVAQLGMAATCNQSMAAIIPNNSVYSRFLFWWLTSNYQNIRNMAGGDLRDGLNLELIGDIGMPSPLGVEATSIANFLDHETAKIDTLIEKQQQLIQLLKEKRQAVISHAVTKGLNPNAPMKDSGVEWLGEVPEHWELKRVGLLFSESSLRASTKIELDYPVLSVSIHHGISDKELNDEELDRKVTRSEDKSLYKIVHGNDLAYNMMRAWQGGFGAATLSGLVSPAYVVCNPKTKIQTIYFELVLRTQSAVTELKRFSRGITDFRLRLYWDEFKNIVLPVPSKDEVDEILKAIHQMNFKYDNLLAIAEKQIEYLKERRTALISAAVTGKIDVRQFVVEEGQAAKAQAVAL